MRIVLATRNRHKAREIAAVLGREVLTLDDVGFQGEVEEAGATFEENARLKARAAAGFLRRGEGGPALVVADDSGLEVDALGGAPGVLSARYAGSPCDDAANNAKVIEGLRGVPVSRRGAQFRCALAVEFAGGPRDGEGRAFEGVVRGRLGFRPKGKRGFGYDPLFFPDGHARTTAEMTAREKNAISHRGAAVRALREWIEAW
jgi:XTP/dITP diphosphohydrolase